ncbi:5-(carboxyamino)imidazole ribonucleotide synthase [Virgibacillus sp. 179-BFC.A HS]|uniref:N5-carboxyaminoimidazole ribonucleotide synthase n=1 Tax=Tigheibacillus jepli TaxID=3035914 RepID=A0ABU5CJU6_9BACI|nr:5-(carboxyamino)imidazole ribonucleotide synthase [Virgibacillus sp. 179-BFC.A HS]MDY0406626.1 5-(carboxyamino)imidazole ribonucleotide synthase [Virgibacillus sp. 179-BFC.A HS]
MQINEKILPPQTIGIIGGGQLGRMMALAAKYMGYQVVVLDPTENCPTAQVADKQITATYDNLQAIRELIAISDVITYEFENVSLKTATYIQKEGKLPQGCRALEVTQNRELEKRAMEEANLPVAPYRIVHDEKECGEALQQLVLPTVMKTCSGGYDGKGQLKIETAEQVQEAMAFVAEKGTCIIEQWVDFDKEISVVFSRSQSGEIQYFPIAENEHRNHILYKTTVPAAISEKVIDKALHAARLLADQLQVVGTSAIEMFVKGDNIYLNEMAPRPHNSGHYTIESCNISQFGQHIRAICNLPLMKVKQLQAAVMVNILGQDLPAALEILQANGQASVHIYGKENAKENRKMGHITYVAETLEEVKAYQLEGMLR